MSSVVKLRNSTCIKIGQGNTVCGNGFQKPVNESVTAPAPTARTPTRKPNYIAVT